jgi:hypothetical protein
MVSLDALRGTEFLKESEASPCPPSVGASEDLDDL